MPLGDLGRVILGQPLRAEGRARRCRGVGHAYLAGGVPRRFKGIGENDGDDLAVVVDLGAELAASMSKRLAEVATALRSPVFSWVRMSSTPGTARASARSSAVMRPLAIVLVTR